MIGINSKRDSLWKLRQSKLHKYFNIKSIVKQNSVRIRKRAVPLKQLFITKTLTLSHTKPVYTHKQYIVKHYSKKRQLRKKSMADIEEFTVNNAEIELHNPVQAEEGPTTPVQDEPTTPGVSTTSNSDNESEEEEGLKTEEIEALKSEFQKQIDQLKQQLNEEKKSKVTNRKRPRKSCSTSAIVPPPPPIGHSLSDEGTAAGGEKKRTLQRTVYALLQHLITIVTIRMDDYATAYTMYQDLQGSKVPQTAVKVIAELMSVWSNGLTTRLGNSCCLEYLMQSINPTLSTKCLASTTWAHLLRFFQNCGTPGGTVQRTTRGSSLSVSTTTMTGPTTTSSTIVHGSTTRAGAADCLDSVHGPKRARHVDPSMYVQKIFEDLQTTSAREGDTIYTSKSTGPIGGTVVKLEIYKFEDIENIPRMQWWSHAQFRGTLMTRQKETLEAAVQLQDLMETEIENRPDTRFIKSSLQNILSRGPSQK